MKGPKRWPRCAMSASVPRNLEAVRLSGGQPVAARFSWARPPLLRRRIFLGGSAAFLLSSTRIWSEAAQISVQGSAFQAFPLFVAVRGLSEGETVKLSLEEKSYSLAWHAASGEYRSVLPLSIDCTRRQVLEMEGGPSRVLEVKPRDFGMQYLHINPDTLASYDNPRNKADDRAILESMKELDPVQRWNAPFRLPCQAPETTGFGQRRLYNGWKKGWHKGLDLGGWEGQTIQAPANGRVVHLATGIVNGNTVVLSHGLGVFSVYLHLLDYQVELGQEVSAGQAIARLGGTGGFAPHLHWEVRCWGGPVHPKAFFQLPRGWS